MRTGSQSEVLSPNNLRHGSRGPPSMRLIEPCIEYRSSYLSFVEEFRSRGEPFVPFVLELDASDFPKFVERIRGFSRGVDLPNGFVPHSTFWLIGDDDQLVAVSNLRHFLTDRLRRDGGHIGYGVRPSARRRGYGRAVLGKTLEHARSRGLDRVMLTARKSNVGSIGVILQNGGILEEEWHDPENGETVRNYWISLG